MNYKDDEFEGEDGDDGSDDEEEERARREMDGEGMEDMEEEPKNIPVLTTKLLNQLLNDSLKKHSVKAIRKLLLAFKEGCAHADNATDNSKANRDQKYAINKNSVFNRLMTACIRNLYKAFDALLPKRTGPLPSSSPHWKKMTPPVKSFVTDYMHFLENSTDKTMILFVLGELEHYVPYVAALKVRHSRKLFKILLSFWSSNPDPNVKIVAFLRIRQMAMTCPFPFIEMCMKGTYLTYVKNAKFVSENSLPSIVLMRNCVVELFSIDMASSYQLAFVYIRQLAIQLRTAIINKTQESCKNVYNWQFVNCLRLWAQLLCASQGDSSLQPLLYPLVQVILGTIKLIPTARYFPLRLHCAEMLIQLGEASSTFIPVAPLLLPILHAKELSTKGAAMKGKPPVLPLLVKYTPAQLTNKVVLEGLVARALQLLSSSFDVHEHSIAYPELVIPSLVQLRKFSKSTNVPHWRNATKSLITKLESRSKIIVQKRALVEFAPHDADKMATFMMKEANEVREQRLAKSSAATAKKDYNDALVLATNLAKKVLY